MRPLPLYVRPSGNSTDPALYATLDFGKVQDKVLLGNNRWLTCTNLIILFVRHQPWYQVSRIEMLVARNDFNQALHIQSATLPQAHAT
jgi:hypothetical protein